MKALKIIAIILGVIVALLVVLVALALTPSIQTWAVRKAVAGQPGVVMNVGRVDAGWSTARISDLRIVQDGAVITVAAIAADYSAWDYLLHHQINVDRVTVQGLVADLRAATAPASAAAGGASAPPVSSHSPNTMPVGRSATASDRPALEGLLRAARLPVDLHLGALAVDARVLLPGDREVAFDLHGGNIATGATGKLEWKIDFTDPLEAASVRAAHTSGTLALRLTADRRLDLAEVQMLAAAEGSNLPADRLRLDLKAEQTSAGGDERYSVHVALVRAEKSEPLFDSVIDYRAAVPQFAGTWNLAVRSESFAAVLASLNLPDVTAEGAGKFTVGPDAATAVGSGELHARLARLENLSPALATLGTLEVQAAFDAGLADDIAHLDRLELNATAADGRKFVEIAAHQKISFNLRDEHVAMDDPAAELARLTVTALPLAWAQSVAQPLAIDHGELSLSLAIVADATGSHLRVNTVTPVTLRDVSLSMDGQPLIQGIDLTADLDATKTGDAVSYDVRQLELKQAAASLLKLHVAGQATLGPALAVSAKGQLDSDLVALLQQPALASFATLAAGHATVSFNTRMADNTVAQATVALHGLTARQDNRALGDIDMTLDAVVKPDGHISIKLPLTLTAAGRRSDLRLDGDFAQTAAKFSFGGKLTGDQLFADDFQAFAVLAPPSSEAAPAAGEKASAGSPPAGTPPVSGSSVPAAPVVADTAPFWAAVGGRFDVDLKKIAYGTDYTIGDVRMTATVDEHRLALDPLEGTFKGNPFKTSVAITFDTAKPARPYALTGAVAVAQFDVGAFLRASNPGEPPSLESKVSVEAKLTGAGATLPDLAENLLGQFDVTGSAGVLRALGRKGGGAVNALSKVVGLFGALKGSDTTTAVADLAAELNEMKFDRFSAHVERDAGLNLKLTALEFLSAGTRITGMGSIEHQPGVPIDRQPLHVEVQLAGKEHMALLLHRLKLLGGKTDDQGYTLMSRPFIIKGTAAKPDASQLWTIVGEAAASGLLR
jgi:hypothetical protein